MPGKERIDDTEEIAQEFGIFTIASEMRMIVHEAIGKDTDLVTGFIFDQEAIIDLLGPIFLKEEGFIVALPGYMEDGTIFKNCIAGETRHAIFISK